jgi:exopolysaccharide biosynthesis polyprenyl glycosylphosphotransferase
MIRRRERLFGEIVLACDMLVLVASLLIAIVLHTFVRDLVNLRNDWPLIRRLWILWIACPVWGLLLYGSGLCSTRSYRSVGDIFTRLIQVQVIGGLILMSAMYLTKMLESRIISQTFLAISYLFLLGEKLGVRAMLIGRQHARKPANRWRVLAVGSETEVEAYLRILREYPYWAVDVAAYIPWGERFGRLESTGTDGVSPYLARHAADLSTAEWHNVLRSQVVDEVVAVLPWEQSLESQSLALACVEKGITFRQLVRMPPAPVGSYHLEDLGPGTYLLSLETIPQLRPALLVKRFIDVVTACAGLVCFGLVYLWYSRVIRRESPGPVLYSQERVGQNGRTFTLYKFRTMYPDAEKRLPELMKHNEMIGSMFKMKDDPRVTPTGKWMRRTHLDELPQFWNVLKGDMSLVGTRPPTPAEVAGYASHHHRRLSMKPGLTGLWQLNGNGSVRDFEDVVRLDCKYIDTWSLCLDSRIIARTLAKMVHQSGW